MIDAGGRALCPSDEYTDLDLAEEMHWHAVEQALTEAYPPDLLRFLRSVQARLAAALGEHGPLQPGQERALDFGFYGQAVLRVRDDSHLGEAFGTTEVLCTLTVSHSWPYFPADPSPWLQPCT